LPWQVVIDPQQQSEAHAKAERLRGEWVVAVTGTLRARQDPNPRLKTGAVELVPAEVKVRGCGWERRVEASSCLHV
jgi:aspartyl-tRNA synthetase